MNSEGLLIKKIENYLGITQLKFINRKERKEGAKVANIYSCFLGVLCGNLCALAVKRI